MGQATVDLPDPTNQPPAPAKSADDLLAQLAGDEIDRLLATGENTTTEAGDVPPMTNEALTEQLLSPAAIENEVTAPAAAPVENDDAYAAQIDTLFKELNAVELKPPLIEESPAPADPIVSEPAAPVPPPEQPTTAAEMAALNAQIETPAADEIATVMETMPEEKPSLLMRLLEVINAPFAAVPDTVRDLLGKIAILTIMNSVGVLLYLMLFRKHH